MGQRAVAARNANSHIAGAKTGSGIPPATHNVEGMGKMRLRTCKLIACAVGMGVMAFGQLSSAAPINYGNFNGTTVQYLQVTEDQTTENPLLQVPLYGSPTLTDDSLSFNPSGFGAQASGAAGNDV